MENQTPQEIKHLNDRLTEFGKRIIHIDNKVEKVDDKVDNIEEKFNDRHINMVELTTTLKADSKASRESTDRLTVSINGLVEEMKESNRAQGKRFERLEDKVGKVEDLVNDKTLAINVGLEEKKLSTGAKVSIFGGIISFAIVLVQVILPILFG
ncbi:hypothetical protein [Mammaliicoccus sciuri]|uniref:hypothetical protein n=1 Tax=Mammaliicoccus sciuri TaxID=1296 RepID=UPI0021CF2C0F|nr:hypothetical protein [Mammaliicoccus sciuri]UXU70086.1 hypothetical protein MUA36_05240 [Mammaliicoccus sciuri]